MSLSGRQIRVLVADDSPTALRSICEYLEFEGGFDVVGTASDGLNAVQQAELLNPDLVVLDLRMPRMNGFIAAAKLRKSMPDLRVIILTDMSGATLRDESARSGADAFVQKHHLPEGLMHEIARMFRVVEE